MRPQNTSSVKQLSKITSTVHTLYCPSGGPLYLQYIRCTAHRGGVNVILIKVHGTCREPWCKNSTIMIYIFTILCKLITELLSNRSVFK